MVIKTIKKSINVYFTETFAQWFFKKIVKKQKPFKFMGTDEELQNFQEIFEDYILEYGSYCNFTANVWYKYDSNYECHNIDTLKEDLEKYLKIVKKEIKKIEKIEENNG